MSEPHIWFYRKKLFEDSGVVYERHEDFKKQESLDGYNIPSVQLVEKSTLDEARKEIERYKSLFEYWQTASAELSDKLATANALLERAGNAMVSGCRCDKRFHLDIMCSDGNRTYYERESCELCSMAKEIEQHREGKL